MVPMRDGKLLATDLLLPDSPGRYPAILERTPYNKEQASITLTGTHTHLVEQGYMVALQDTRGRFASEGTWYPFRDDGWGVNQDGHDTVEWLAAHPKCTGAVGTIGGSYSGNTQLLLAPTLPRGLQCMCVRQAAVDLTSAWVYRGGAFELGFNFLWGTNQSVPALEHRVAQLKGTAATGIQSVFGALPAGANPLYENPFQWLVDYLSHSPEDETFWEQWKVSKHYSNIEVPVLHIGGWYDIFLQGALAGFTGISGHSATPQSRQSQKLLVGPWRHGPMVDEQFMRKIGELDFGPAAAIDFNHLIQRWFDCWLKGEDQGVRSEPAVTVFVMGANEWKHFPAWPPPETQTLKYYLHGGPSRGTSSLLKDGALALEPPNGGESPDGYSYDPLKPLATMGGNTLFALPEAMNAVPPGLSPLQTNLAKLGAGAGPRDHRLAEKFCLTYTSAPLENNLEVIGPVVARIYASSSAVDTDFIARLTDVWPDGRSMLVTDGILRARYRESETHPSPLEPGKVYLFSIDLWATANVFKKGHSIRLAISSSNFPRFDRNLNVWNRRAAIGEAVIAHNAVFHNSAHPSHIKLSVLRRS